MTRLRELDLRPGAVTELAAAIDEINSKHRKSGEPKNLFPVTREDLWDLYKDFSDAKQDVDRDPDNIDAFTCLTSLKDTAGFLPHENAQPGDVREWLKRRVKRYVQAGGNPDSRSPQTIEEFIEIMFPEQSLKAA